MNLRTRLQRIGKAILSPGALLTIAALVLALLAWFLGPLLAFGDVQPLGPVSVRLAIVLVIALAWGIAGYFIRIRRNSADKALLAGLRRQQEEQRQAGKQVRATTDAELAAFRGMARGATQYTNKGRGFNPLARDRHQTPWYLVLGSQNAGKTAIVLNSSLAFSYQGDNAAGAPAVFHLADQAVFVEIAGKFLVPYEPPANSLWLGMLDHLSRLRPRQPASGIIVTVSADELMTMTPEGAIDLAGVVRRRLDEAAARLRTRPPVYVIVSKLDLLVGFEEFFDTLSAEERNAVLGFPLRQPSDAKGQAPADDRFTQGFSDTVERLSGLLLLRLQEEPDEHRRRRAFEFPSQFAAMQAVLEPFITQLTFIYRFEPAPLLRGLFFASATQNGLSMDVLARDLSPSFAQQAEKLAFRNDAATGRGRPYFLRDLVRDIVIPEANLGGLTRSAAAMLQIRGIAANVLLTLAVLALLVFWWLGFNEGQAYTKRLQDGVTAARASIASALSAGTAPLDFKPALTALDDLRALAQERPDRATFGLYGTASVEEAAREAYDRGIHAMMLPFVWRYLRDGLDDPQTAAALRFHQLKLYLMMTGERPVDAQTAALFGPDFAQKWLPYDRTADVERRVSEHLAELSFTVIAAPLMDMRLVDRARGLISNYTLARLAYDALNAMPRIQQLGTWRPVDHMGLSGPQALALIGGGSFWDGIPGLFTRTGFFDSALPTTGAVSDDLAADLWVMGVADTVTGRERETQRIREGMLDLYRVDYMRRWDSFLSELTIVDSADAGETARAMAIITGSPSPVKELTAAAAAEVNLTPASDPASALTKAATAQVNRVAGSVIAPSRVVDVGKAVTDHFKLFAKAVSAPEGQQSQIDTMLAGLQPLYSQINLVATGANILELGTQPQTVLNQLTEQVNALPDSLQPLFRRILSQAGAVTSGSSRQRLAEIWKTTVEPSCQATTKGRYPFVQASAEDTSIADFTSLFGPKGLISSFRNDYLKPFIDTTTKPWRWRTGQQVGLNIGDDVLAAFEHAQDITTTYFGDADTPSVKFTVEPVQLDEKARAMQFDIGGPTLVYMHGPPTPSAFQWPPDRADADAILSMTPEVNGERNMLRKQGPWALFRLFNAGHVLRNDPTDMVPFGFTVGSRKAVLNVMAPTTRNPFARDILSDFKCPVL